MSNPSVLLSSLLLLLLIVREAMSECHNSFMQLSSLLSLLLTGTLLLLTATTVMNE